MPKQWFFQEQGFEFAALQVLGATAYRMAEAGEVLATVERIADGDADLWFEEWMTTAKRVHSIAEESEKAGHVASARDAYLRASVYAGAAFFYVLATQDPGREIATWRWHRAAFEKAMHLWPTPVEKVDVPYEGTHLHGYPWSAGNERRPVVILVNGSDGPVSDMLSAGALDAVARGYHAITVDGPGQGYALYEQKLYFRRDWEAVITPVVDFLLKRPDVDPARIAMSGLSQAGYWVPRAAAYEHRIAAAVADPGVVRVGESWTRHFPPELLGMIDAGQTSEFDQIMAQVATQNPSLKLTAAKRLEPYGVTSIAAVLTELKAWDLTDDAPKIACPILITSPEDEQFWPGQSQELYDLVTAAGKELTVFTAAEGANWHCEPMAPQVRAQRIFDWLDTVLA